MYISMISVLAPTILGASIFNRLSVGLKILAVFIFVTCLLEGVVFIAFRQSVNNMAIFHLYTYLEFGFISAIYYHFYKSNQLRRMLILFQGILFTCISIYSLVAWEYLDKYNSIQRGVEHILLLVSLLLFTLTFLGSSNMRKYRIRPYFILTVGFLIYFSGTFLIFLNANKYIEVDQLSNWSVHSILNIFLNSIYFAVLWTEGKRNVKFRKNLNQ